ncbi:MAG: hypothetical protein EZS28_053508, partial [Streblomastix strix]
MPTNSYGTEEHLQPVGQFDDIHLHESFVTVELEDTVQFFSDWQVEKGQLVEPVSQTQEEFGIFGPVQQAGHYPYPALGSEVNLHSHLEEGIPVNYDESVGHLQPEGQFVFVHVHESQGTVELELAVHFLSDQHNQGGYYAKGFESQTQFAFGQSFAVQQAGHVLLALGSPVLKHGHVILKQDNLIFQYHKHIIMQLGLIC